MRLAPSFIAAVVLFVAAPALAASAGFSPAEAAALRSYTLSLDKLHRYNAALIALGKDAAAHPDLKAESDRADEEPSNTIADLTAKLKRHPRIAGYFHKAGLSDLDAVLFPLVVMNASVAAQMPATAAKLPVTPAQIAFAKAHKQELANLGGE